MTSYRASAPHVLVTGGAGYIGSMLTRRLVERGCRVRVLDAEIFGSGLTGFEHPGLEVRRADIRDADGYRQCLEEIEVVVHLAAVANDPSFDLDPELGRSVNFDCLEHVMRLPAECEVRRFIYASSASVYGVSDAPEVDERHPVVPITDYNRYKAAGEQILFTNAAGGYESVAVRAATVCGVSHRQRLDLTVNLLTAQAVDARRITVFGGEQFRPNVHVRDLVDVYDRLVRLPSLGELDGTAVNVGNQNLTIAQIAQVISKQVAERMATEVAIERTESDDKRSYRLTSTRLRQTLGMVPSRTVGEAAAEVADAILAGRLPDPLTDDRYYNVRWMATNGGATGVTGCKSVTTAADSGPPFRRGHQPSDRFGAPEGRP